MARRKVKPSAEDLLVLAAHAELLDPPDYSAMDDDALEACQIAMSNLRARVLERGRAIQAERDLRAAGARLADMTDRERAALAQAISGAGGIESTVKVGKPGS